MAIRTSRAEGVAEVLVDYERCTSCGLCVEVCKGYPLYMEEHTLKVDQTRGFGCIACGACVAVCPTEAIRIRGRDLLPEDVLPIPARDERTGYGQLQGLLLSRRSTRHFTNEEVDPQLVEKILAAAATAPVGLPPSDVGVLVFSNHQAVRRVRDFLLKEMRPWKYIFSPLMISLMRPFISKENAQLFGDFIAPAVEMMQRKAVEGEDWFLYNAPLALFFYGSAYSDPADSYLAAALAMLAGETLGLGTCVLGFPGSAFKNSAKARKEYHLPQKIQPGLMVIFGHPKYSNGHAIRRRFASVSVYDH